jgi:hypothetical protein
MTEEVGDKRNETRDERSGAGLPSPLQRRIEGGVAAAIDPRQDPTSLVGPNAAGVSVGSKAIEQTLAMVRNLSTEVAVLRKVTQALRQEVSTLRNRVAEINSELREFRGSTLGGRLQTVRAPSGAPPRLHRGNNTREMADYAGEIGGRVVAEADQRCSFCAHKDGWFVRKGGKLLCQVCFAQGMRPF